MGIPKLPDFHQPGCVAFTSNTQLSYLKGNLMRSSRDPVYKQRNLAK